MSFDDADLLAEMPRLRRYARSLTRDPDRADDLMQETLARAIAKRELFQPGSNLRGWLLRICHNQYISEIRKSSRREEVELTEFNGGTVDPSAMNNIVHKDVRSIIDILPPQTRLILDFAAHGRSYDWIADELFIPANTVKSRLRRARELLRGAL